MPRLRDGRRSRSPACGSTTTSRSACSPSREVIAQSSNVGAIKIGLRGGDRRGSYRTLTRLRLRRRHRHRPAGREPRHRPAGRALGAAHQGLRLVRPGPLGDRPAARQRLRARWPTAASCTGRTWWRRSGAATRREPPRRRPVRARRLRRDPALARANARAVVSEGTGKRAAVPGYAGRRQDRHRAEGDPRRLLARPFTRELRRLRAGARAGRWSASVVLDEPRGAAYHGGDVAAPVFGAIAREALLYLGVAPERRPRRVVAREQKPPSPRTEPRVRRDRSPHCGRCCRRDSVEPGRHHAATARLHRLDRSPGAVSNERPGSAPESLGPRLRHPSGAAGRVAAPRSAARSSCGWRPGRVAVSQGRRLDELVAGLPISESGAAALGLGRRPRRRGGRGRHDSRRVEPGDLFVTWSGGAPRRPPLRRRRRWSAARWRCSHRAASDAAGADASVPWLVAAEPRRCSARSRRASTAHPDRELVMVGVTGTNGKTTTATLLASDPRRRRLPGRRPRHARLLASPATTSRATARRPRPRISSGCCAGMRDARRRAVAMEVSSHALVQGRVDGRALRRRGLHQSDPRPPRLPSRPSSDYFAAKRALRAARAGRRAVVNADDACGPPLLAELARRARLR